MTNKDLERKRIRIQRFIDARIAYGWVERLDRTQLYIKFNVPMAYRIGDEVFCEVATDEAGLAFKAKYAGHSGDSERFEVWEQPISTTNHEEPRFKVEGLEVAVDLGWIELREPVLDISPRGISFLSKAEIELGSELTLKVIYGNDDITASGKVMNCKKLSNTGDKFRIGLRLNEFSRLDGAKWLRFRDAA